jgi:hypothetical protein
MKKLFYYLCVMMAVLSLGACSDVPAPYELFLDVSGQKLPFSSSSLNDFDVVSEEGIDWSLGSTYAKATGYNSTDKTYTGTKTWLVSPALNTETTNGAKVKFDFALRYGTVSNYSKYIKVLITTDYDKENPAASPWTELAYTPKQTDSSWNFENSGWIAIPEEYCNKENVRIAFYYECPDNDSSNTATWELKSFQITTGAVESGDDNTDNSGDDNSGDNNEDNGEYVPVAGNLLTNGGFETWNSDSEAAGWKSASSASNATVSKSTNAHSDSYAALVEGHESYNRRLATTEMTLKAGTYEFVFYVKGAADGASARAGYVPVTNGSVGNYIYGDYVNSISASSWTKVTYSFTLDSETTVCLVVMNPKNCGNLIIDDASLTTTNGGLVSGGTETTPDDTDTTVTPSVPGGENLITNGDFESWVSDSEATAWKSASTASNATVSKSTDAHAGSYAVQIEGFTQNKRLGSIEMTLKAGTYTFSFYAKGVADGASVRPGYVPVNDGSVGSYVYGEYTNNISTTDWQLITHEFTLAEETTVSLVVMNPKNCGSVLIDDASLTTSNGGIVK